MKDKKNISRGAAGSQREEDSSTTALTVHMGEIAFPQGVETLGERANYLHAYSVEASKRSIGAAILAGWVLSVARSTCAYGQWMQWLRKNVSFSESTARNYLSLYAQTLGAQRAAMRRPIALDVQPTAEELEAASHDVDGKALSSLYKSTRLMAASENWGGAGRGQGRKARGAEDEAKELDEAANSPALIYAAVKGPLDALWQLHSERDAFARLGDAELAEVVATLKTLANESAKAFKARGK